MEMEEVFETCLGKLTVRPGKVLSHRRFLKCLKLAKLLFEAFNSIQSKIYHSPFKKGFDTYSKDWLCIEDMLSDLSEEWFRTRFFSYENMVLSLENFHRVMSLYWNTIRKTVEYTPLESFMPRFWADSKACCILRLKFSLTL